MSDAPFVRRQLLRWHRRLAWLALLPVLAWSLTGLLHPLMSRWQPSAAAMQPPAAMLTAPAGMRWHDLPPPAVVLSDDRAMRDLRLLNWQGRAYWLSQTSDGALHYTDARTGQAADIGPAMLEALARHYTGATEAVSSLTRVTAYSDEYAFINRYLPVWRVAFDRPDGLVAFIEPRSLALAGLSDHWKTRFAWMFGNLHSWKWWPHEPSRDIAMALLLTSALLLVLSGVFRSFSGARSSVRPGLRRWHRRLGLTVALAGLAWMSSGIFHVLAIDKGRPMFATHPLALAFEARALVTPPPADVPDGARLQVLAAPDGPLWHWYRLRPAISPQQAHADHAAGGGHGHGAPLLVLEEAYLSALSGAAVSPDRYVRALAAAVAPRVAWSERVPITGFTHEYGFVQKRLPVYRLAFDTADNLTVYVDPADAAVAAVVRDLDRAEGFAFAYLHKANWLDFLGRDVRDAIAAMFALGVFALSLIGGRFLVRRRLP